MKSINLLDHMPPIITVNVSPSDAPLLADQVRASVLGSPLNEQTRQKVENWIMGIHRTAQFENRRVNRDEAEALSILHHAAAQFYHQMFRC